MVVAESIFIVLPFTLEFIATFSVFGIGYLTLSYNTTLVVENWKGNKYWETKKTCLLLILFTKMDNLFLL